MFDRYTLGPRSMDVNVHHTEKREPTDESVRLLREMESAARTKIVESLQLKSNDFVATVHRHESMEDLTTVFAIFYSLNGTRREVRVTLDREPVEDSTNLLWKAISEDMATYLLQGYFQQLLPAQAEPVQQL